MHDRTFCSDFAVMKNGIASNLLAKIEQVDSTDHNYSIDLASLVSVLFDKLFHIVRLYIL